MLPLHRADLAHVAKRYAEFRIHGAAASHAEKYGHGITVNRYFTKEGVHPYEEIVWEKRDAVITNSKGAIVFEQKRRTASHLSTPVINQAMCGNFNIFL